MNTLNFTKLLRSPSKLKKKQLASIESLIKEFPYFQSAHALHLKSLKSIGSYKYNKALKTTAAYTTDRSILFDFITSEAFLQNIISEQIKNNHEGLKTLEVTDYQDISNHSKREESLLKMGIDSTDEINEGDDSNPKAAEILNLGAPLEFNKNDTLSFVQWLQLTKAKPIDRSKNKKETSSKQSKNFDLIDAFISKNPKIKPVEKEGIIENIAEQRTEEPEQLMTETLARIYVEQKNYERAIQSYTILSLKYPEKSGLFADQIKAIQQLQEKNKNS
jgi:hypothetical protein